MSRLTSKLLGVASAAMLGASAFAYEMPTHRVLSEQAAVKSRLSQPDVLADLGLTKPITDLTQTFPIDYGSCRRK